MNGFVLKGLLLFCFVFIFVVVVLAWFTPHRIHMQPHVHDRWPELREEAKKL